MKDLIIILIIIILWLIPQVIYLAGGPVEPLLIVVCVILPIILLISSITDQREREIKNSIKGIIDKTKKILKKLRDYWNDDISDSHITLEQLAESVVEIPHMSNQMNQVAVYSLIKAFQPDEEQKVYLATEYTAFSFSLWWFRYESYLQVKYESKIYSFNTMVGDLLNSYIKRAYLTEYIEKFTNFYATRVESYEKAYSTSNQIENIADVLCFYISFGLKNKGPCLYPVNVPVDYRFLDFLLPEKMICAAVTADLWEFINKHMKGWKVV